MNFIHENPLVYLAIACLVALIADAAFRAFIAKCTVEETKNSELRKLEVMRRNKAAQSACERTEARFARGLPLSDSGDGWFALIGSGHLELRDTGFYIQFKPSQRDHPYCLYSPDGGLICCSASLQAVKVQGVIASAERAEFASWSKGQPS